MKEGTGLLLERARHERVRGGLHPWFRGGMKNRCVRRGMNELQIILCGLLVFQLIVHGHAKRGRGQRRSREAHHGRQFPARGSLKGLNGVFSFHHETQRRSLAAPRGEGGGHILPEKGAHCKSDHHVQHGPRLLRMNTVHVHVSWMVDGVLNGRLGDFMEHGALDRFRVQFQKEADRIGNELSLPIIVCRHIDLGRLFGRLFQCLDRGSFFLDPFIRRLKFTSDPHGI